MDFKELNFDYSPLADAWTADDMLEYRNTRSKYARKPHFKGQMMSLTEVELLILLLAITFTPMFGYAFFGSIGAITTLVFFCLAIPGFIIVGDMRKFRYPEEEIRMYNFARKNRFSYRSGGKLTGKTGRIFSSKIKGVRDRRLSGVLKGQGELKFLEFGQYTYKMRGQKRETFYIEVTLPFAAYDLVVDSLEFPVVAEPGWGKNLVDLEGDFNKYFRIRADYNHQSQAVSFLAPDLMNYLINNMQNCDIELVGNKLYFYYPQADGVFKIPAQSVIEAENAEEIIAKYNLEGVRQIKTNLVSVEDFLKRFGKNIKFLENISSL